MSGEHLIDFAQLIWVTMKVYVTLKKNGNMSYGSLVTLLCKRAGVKQGSGDVLIPLEYGLITKTTTKKSKAMSSGKKATPESFKIKTPLSPNLPTPGISLFSRFEQKVKNWHTILLKRVTQIEERQERMEQRHEYAISVSEKCPVPVLFSQRLKAPPKVSNYAEMLELFRQIKVNIPLLDAINQVPSYAKFFKDLCPVKRKLNVQKRAFLTEQASSIIQTTNS